MKAYLDAEVTVKDQFRVSKEFFMCVEKQIYGILTIKNGHYYFNESQRSGTFWPRFQLRLVK